MPRLFLVSEASRSDGLGGKEQRCVSELVGRRKGDAGMGCRVGGLSHGEDLLKVLIKMVQHLSSSSLKSCMPGAFITIYFTCSDSAILH